MSLGILIELSQDVVCRGLRRARARIDLSRDAETAWQAAWRSYAFDHLPSSTKQLRLQMDALGILPMMLMLATTNVVLGHRMRASLAART